MATFGEVVEAVLAMSGRPDKEASARAQVNIAVRRIAGSSNYPLALYEVQEAGPFQSAINTFPLVERFQSVGYVRAPAAESAEPSQPQLRSGEEGKLNPIQPNDIINLNRSFGYYISGNNLITRALAVPEVVLIGWHQYPAALREDTETNWVLDRFDYLVEEMAVAHLLTVVGAASAAQGLQRFTASFLQQEVRSATNPYESGA